MRLIFINRFFYPDHSATSQLLADLAFGLAKKGHDVTVIASRLRYDNPAANLEAQERIDAVRVVRVWTSSFGRASLILRAFDYLTFYFAAAWALVWRVGRRDVVIAMTDPPVFSVIAAIVARLRGAHLVNWLQDVFPEIAEALSAQRGSASLLYAPLRHLRNASLRSAQMNVAIGDLMAERVRQLGVPRNRISVIANWADTDSIRPMGFSKGELCGDRDRAHHFVVAYSGNLGRAHDVETLLGAIAASVELSAHASEIRWIFIGGGAGYEKLRSETKRLGCGNVSFHGYQPRHLLAASLSAADVHIVSLKPDLEGLIVPSKFYGIAAAGRPMIFIGSPHGEAARLIEKYGCGASVAIGNTRALLETINSMAENPKLCASMGQQARAMCVEAFSKESAISSWHDLIEGIADVSRSKSAKSFDALRYR